MTGHNALCYGEVVHVAFKCCEELGLISSISHSIGQLEQGTQSRFLCLQLLQNFHLQCIRCSHLLHILPIHTHVSQHIPARAAHIFQHWQTSS
jgi:hypothetical protein